MYKSSILSLKVIGFIKAPTTTLKLWSCVKGWGKYFYISTCPRKLSALLMGWNLKLFVRRYFWLKSIFSFKLYRSWELKLSCSGTILKSLPLHQKIWSCGEGWGWYFYILKGSILADTFFFVFFFFLLFIFNLPIHNKLKCSNYPFLTNLDINTNKSDQSKAYSR